MKNTQTKLVSPKKAHRQQKQMLRWQLRLRHTNMGRRWAANYLVEGHVGPTFRLERGEVKKFSKEVEIPDRHPKPVDKSKLSKTALRKAARENAKKFREQRKADKTKTAPAKERDGNPCWDHPVARPGIPSRRRFSSGFKKTPADEPSYCSGTSKAEPLSKPEKFSSGEGCQSPGR